MRTELAGLAAEVHALRERIGTIAASARGPSSARARLGGERPPDRPEARSEEDAANRGRPQR
jgi:hypothetical protein